MQEKLRGAYNRVAPVIAGASALLSRLFLVAVVIPATAGMLMLAAASGWSFTGAALMVAEVQADAQQLGKATSPGYLLVKRCDAPRQVAGSMPKPSDAICTDWVVEQVAVHDVASYAGRQLFGLYLVLFFVSAGGVFMFWPQSRLRVRERIVNDLVAMFHKLKSLKTGKPSA